MNYAKPISKLHDKVDPEVREEAKRLASEMMVGLSLRDLRKKLKLSQKERWELPKLA